MIAFHDGPQPTSWRTRFINLGSLIPLRVLFALAFLCAFHARAQDRLPFESNSPWETNVGIATLDLATNSKQAWRLIEMVGPVSVKSGKWSELERNAAGADMCREFSKRYPADSNVGLADKRRREYLIRTIELGNTNRIAEFEDLFPKKATELARLRAYRAFSLGPSAVRAEWEKNLRSLTPGSPDIEFEMLLLAEQSEPENARRLAEELIKVSLSKNLKERASKILKRYEPVGQPIRLKATLADGAQLDLDQWKGKVILLHFWMARRPNDFVPSADDWGFVAVRTAYERFHARGLEVLGINQTRDPALARSAIANAKATWPQYLASTNLPPELRVVAGMAPGQVGVGIPGFALVDHDGILRDREIPREELIERIEKLLK